MNQLFRVSRAGRKLPAVDAQPALDAPERIWAEISRKEDAELAVSALREEVLAGVPGDAREAVARRARARAAAGRAVRGAAGRLMALEEARAPGGSDPAVADPPPAALPRDAWARCSLSVRHPPRSSPASPPVAGGASPPEPARARVPEIPPACRFPGRVSLRERHDQRALQDAGDHVQASPTAEGAVGAVGAAAADSEHVQRVTDYADGDDAPLQQTSKPPTCGRRRTPPPALGARRRTLPPLAAAPPPRSLTSTRGPARRAERPERSGSPCSRREGDGRQRGHRWETLYVVSAEVAGQGKPSRGAAGK